MIKVLMLGWELPPHISGGLGTACHGILQGLSRHGGVYTRFALPALAGGEDHACAELITAQLGLEWTAALRGEGGAYAPGIDSLVQDYAVALDCIVPGQVDVLHAHDWLTVPAALRLRLRCSAPLVLHVHSTEFDRAPAAPSRAILAIERAGMDAATAIVTVSQATRRQLVERFGQPSDKIHVVYNGIELGPGTASRAPQALRPTVSFIGRMTAQKGPLLFLDTARRVLEQRPDCYFIMAGDGDMMQAVRRRRAEWRMEASLELTGFVGRERLAAVLARSSVVLMPSLAEPFGLVALEAIASSVPLVLSQRAGVAEVISGALKVDPQDGQAMAEAVLSLLDDPAYGAELAASARMEAGALTWDRAATHLYHLYTSLLHASTPSCAPTGPYSSADVEPATIASYMSG